MTQLEPDRNMTGIAGFFTREKGLHDKEVMPAILHTLSDGMSGDELVVDQKTLPGRGGIMAARRGGHVGGISVEFVKSSCTLFIHGDMYGCSADELLEKYTVNRGHFLHNIQVDGAFSGALFDVDRKRILIFSDPFGLEPLYYYLNDTLFTFASVIKGLLCVPGVNRSVDLGTMASFWNFGYAMLDHTPFKHIHLLAPGTVFVLDLTSWHHESHTYAHLIDLFTGKETNKHDLNTVASVFHQAVQKRSADMDSVKLGLSLSGGLDSRAILGGVGKRAAGLTTYTLGLPGCADERLAAKMADRCHCSHTFVPIDESALADFQGLAAMMVDLSDGLYHPHESTERVALNYLTTQPFDVMLRGHGGEIAKAALAYPVQATREMNSMNSADVVGTLFDKASLAGHGIDMSELLSPSIFAATDGMAQRMFEQAAEPAIEDNINNIDLCIYLYIDQWIRRQVVASLSLFRCKVGVRLPYLDRDFLTGLLSLPVEQRWRGEFHKHFIHHYAPLLESIPDSNTGAPLTAGSLRLLITDKVNAVLKRLGVTGFRHYTEFQKWQRKYFNDAIKEILFSEKCLDRGYYRVEGLRQVYDDHVSGKRSYGHFLGTAVAIELWHRKFVDS